MISTVIQDQFARVLQDFPDAALTEQPDGSVHLEVRSVPLPSGWNTEVSSILVVLPGTFPDARPSGFYAPNDLNFAVGDVGGGQHDVAGRRWRHFCWQVQTWDPARDTLWKYVKAMLLRFHEIS